MHWGAYEVFSVLAGVVLVICAFLPGLSAGSRLGALAVGIGFAVYGVYVASKSSGVYYFPVWIFVIPFLGVLYIVGAIVSRAGESTHARPPVARPAASPLQVSSPPAVPPPPVQVSQRHSVVPEEGRRRLVISFDDEPESVGSERDPV